MRVGSYEYAMHNLYQRNAKVFLNPCNETYITNFFSPNREEHEMAEVKKQVFLVAVVFRSEDGKTDKIVDGPKLIFANSVEVAKNLSIAAVVKNDAHGIGIDSIDKLEVLVRPF